MIYESVQTQRCFHFTLNSTHTLYTHTHTRKRHRWGQVWRFLWWLDMKHKESQWQWRRSEDMTRKRRKEPMCDGWNIRRVAAEEAHVSSGLTWTCQSGDKGGQREETDRHQLWWWLAVNSSAAFQHSAHVNKTDQLLHRGQIQGRGPYLGPGVILFGRKILPQISKY